MTGTDDTKPKREKTIHMSRPKRWVITIGIFMIVQLIFILVDGTSLEPNINDSDNSLVSIARTIMESKLFTEWITLYSFPFFNMFTTVCVIAILLQAVQDLRSIAFQKNHKEG